MWQRFTERARRVIFFAQEEAERLGTRCVDTEHLLLGLIRDRDSVAIRILDRLGVSGRKIRPAVEKQVERGGEESGGRDMELAPRAKRIVDLAYDEARMLNNNYIGTEHLLLGLIRESEGRGGRVLAELGVDLDRARREVMLLQDHAPPERYSGSREHERRVPRAAPPLHPGDLGVLRPATDREEIELACDEDAFLRLVAVFHARDHHGYRELRDGGRIVRVPDGTLIKVLVFDGDGPAAGEGGCRVRVLSGDWEGRAGWVAQGNIEIAGPDQRPFPPVPGDMQIRTEE